jgi:hypothetical protein
MTCSLASDLVEVLHMLYLLYGKCRKGFEAEKRTVDGFCGFREGF